MEFDQEEVQNINTVAWGSTHNNELLTGSNRLTLYAIDEAAKQAHTLWTKE